MAYSFNDAKAAERHEVQYFERFCNRGIYHKDWTAVTRHSTPWVVAKLPALDEDIWELYAPDARLVATVHDEVLAECPEDAAEATAQWLVRHMTGAMQELVVDRVPIIVEPSIGRSWAGGDAQ